MVRRLTSAKIRRALKTSLDSDKDDSFLLPRISCGCDED